MSGFWIIDENSTVNCDKAETIGVRIQKSLDNQVFASCSFKRKDQIANLKSRYSSITIDKERVAIEPRSIPCESSLSAHNSNPSGCQGNITKYGEIVGTLIYGIRSPRLKLRCHEIITTLIKVVIGLFLIMSCSAFEGHSVKI